MQRTAPGGQLISDNGFCRPAKGLDADQAAINPSTKNMK